MYTICGALFLGHAFFKYHHCFLSQDSSNFPSFYYIQFNLLSFPTVAMLPKFISPFKMESQEGKHVSKRRKYVRSFESSNLDVGLRLLPQITTSKNTSNVVLKSALRKTNQSIPQDFCFLKTCNLCNKQLSPDKDIYMYRGDQGFCSVECRNRQIVLDEMRELENSTKQMVAAYRKCCSEASRETRLILEDLRMQRLKSEV